MKEDLDKKLSEKYCPRFGMIAIDKGFVTSDQLKSALTKQIEDNLSDKPHRVIGRIMFEEGWMTHQQIEVVLNKLFKEERVKKKTDLKGLLKKPASLPCSFRYPLLYTAPCR